MYEYIKQIKKVSEILSTIKCSLFYLYFGEKNKENVYKIDKHHLLAQMIIKLFILQKEYSFVMQKALEC